MTHSYRFAFLRDDPPVSLVDDSEIDDVIEGIDYCGDSNVGGLSIYLRNEGRYHTLGDWPFSAINKFVKGARIRIEHHEDDGQQIVIIQIGEPQENPLLVVTVPKQLYLRIGEMLRFANEYKNWGHELSKIDDSQLQSIMTTSKYF